MPNLFGIFAEAPAVAEAYLQLSGLFGQSSSFDLIEQQVVLMTTVFENECTYCMAAHTAITTSENVPCEIIEALRAGKTLPDARLGPRGWRERIPGSGLHEGPGSGSRAGSHAQSPQQLHQSPFCHARRRSVRGAQLVRDRG